MNLSKSKYTRFCQCPKMLWLDTYKGHLAVENPAVQARFEAGNEVCELAKGLLGKHVEATAYKQDGRLDIGQMLHNTKRFVEAGEPNICEAAFIYDGCYCAVDILHKTENGYAIYEVKSSTDVSEVYLQDVAYQKYVLENCGLTITGTYIVHINNKYERQGELDIKKLFCIANVQKKIKPYFEKVKRTTALAKEYLTQNDEPSKQIGEYCKNPYECAYWQYCSKHISKPSVFDLYRMPFKKACELVNDGICTYQDVLDSNVQLSAKQAKQISHHLFDLPMQVDKIGVKSFLDELSYPLYFLDFESFQSCIPLYDGQHPYEQVPFQYSLHIIKDDLGKVEHKEFLSQEHVDPRRPIAESLVRDIPKDVCTLAYNKSFECSRLKELARLFPDLSEHLLNICDNIKDLLDVFRHGYVYNKAMGGSFSIKSVLPAMFPNEPNLNYLNLEDVHNGTEATAAYFTLQTLEGEQKKKLRQSLLAYCKLDTFAMVMLWQRLRELVI